MLKSLNYGAISVKIFSVYGLLAFKIFGCLVKIVKIFCPKNIYLSNNDEHLLFKGVFRSVESRKLSSFVFLFRFVEEERKSFWENCFSFLLLFLT